MKLFFYVMLLIGLEAGVAAGPLPSDLSLSPSPERTSDGKFDSRCFSWGKDSSREICRVSFYRLLAVPEKYHGKLVVVTGFLIDASGHAVLFPSRESYNAKVEEEGIELLDGSLPKEIKVNLRNGVWPVSVVGVFDGHYSEGAASRLGALRYVQSVFIVWRSRSTSD